MACHVDLYSCGWKDKCWCVSLCPPHHKPNEFRSWICIYTINTRKMANLPFLYVNKCMRSRSCDLADWSEALMRERQVDSGHRNVSKPTSDIQWEKHFLQRMKYVAQGSKQLHFQLKCPPIVLKVSFKMLVFPNHKHTLACILNWIEISKEVTAFSDSFKLISMASL